MNETVGMAREEQPKIKSLLEFQTDIWDRTNSRHKDLYEIINRLDVLANKLNSVDYPKNFPQTITESGVAKENKLSEQPTPPDGIIGLLIDHNNRDNDQYHKLADSIIPQLYDAVSYIEKHI